jgi:competence ComEA-like helix-hairpin-helix protein
MPAPRDRRNLLVMTDNESRALARTTAILVLAAAVRWGLSVRAGPPLVEADSALALPGLLAESQREREEEARRRAPLGEGERIDANQASEIELDRLPGVGPAAARAIVSARDGGGGFAGPEDLLEVRGIGPATLERMRPHLAFSGSATASRGPPGSFSAAAARSTLGEATGGPSGLLDLNSATQSQLEELPGVGPSLAARILAERERVGRFGDVSDLLSVRGIGEATLERLRARVAVP